MAQTTSNQAIPYAELTDSNNLAYVSQTLAERVDTLITEHDALHTTSGTLTAHYGTYSGQPLRVLGGYKNITTNSSSLGTLSMGTDFTGGLLSVTLTSTDDPNYQFRIVKGAGNANSIQVVVRTATGPGAGAVTAGAYYIAIGWDA